MVLNSCREMAASAIRNVRYCAWVTTFASILTITEDGNLAQSTRALELIGKHHGAFDKSAHVSDVTVMIIKPKRIEDYTDEELGEIIARGESERAGDE